ncbi:unnamed protein product [Sympodiomycopsis kandeliae]
MSDSSFFNTVTLTSGVTSGEPCVLQAPPSRRRQRYEQDRNMQPIQDCESDDKTLIGYEDATKNDAAKQQRHGADAHLHLLNDQHLLQLSRQKRQDEIMSSWLKTVGMDVTDAKNGPAPQCTVEELLGAMDAFFGTPMSDFKKQNQTGTERKARKSGKAKFVEKCKGLKWTA